MLLNIQGLCYGVSFCLCIVSCINNYVIHFFTAASARIVTNYPGQYFQLSCDVTGGTVSWFINGQGAYTVSQLFSGVVAGYNSSGNNLIIKDIVMNDPRNNTVYRCVIQSSDTYGDLIFLHVAGEYTYVYVPYVYVMIFLYVHYVVYLAM